MLTEAEVDSLAREILTRIVEDERSSPLFEEVKETLSGEIVPVYSSRSENGFGGFRCEYMPLEPIKKIIVECERLFDECVIKLTDSETGNSLQKKLSDTSATNRKVAITTMADCAALHLIVSFRNRLCDLLEDTVDDSGIIANSFLASVVVQILTDGKIGKATADARPEIQRAVERAADKRRALILSFLKSLPSVLSERGRGGARNVKHVWADEDRDCLATRYAELQPIWIEAKRIARIAQKSTEATRKKGWRKEVLGVYPDLPLDLLERFATLRGDDAKPSNIAILHAARLCLPPNVQLSIGRLRDEIKAWKNKPQL